MSWLGSERAAILRDARKSALLRMRDRVNAKLPCDCLSSLVPRISSCAATFIHAVEIPIDVLPA
jgi:hypothetical protein